MIVNDSIVYGLSGIYQIKNRITGDRYVGSSIDIRGRLLRHRSYLRRGAHANPILQNVFDKYGEDNLEFTVLLLCPKDETLKYEQAFLNNTNTKYNIALDVSAPTLGRKSTENTKRLLSKVTSGKNNPFYGRRHTKKTKELISKKKKGKKPSEECIKKRSGENHWLYGKHRSKETREKISKALQGQNNPMFGKGENHPQYGTHMSESTKEKLRQINLGKQHTEETKIKCGNAGKKYWSNRKDGEPVDVFHERMRKARSNR